MARNEAMVEAAQIAERNMDLCRSALIQKAAKRRAAAEPLCTPTSTLLERIGDETTRRAGRLHDELGLPRSCVERWAHDQRADERRERQWLHIGDGVHYGVGPVVWQKDNEL